MAHNRVITINTSSAILEKRVLSLLFYLNIAQERILTDTDYPSDFTDICELGEAKSLVSALNYLFVAGIEAQPEDAEIDFNEFVQDVSNWGESV
jgi:hypothetical protein